VAIDGDAVAFHGPRVRTSFLHRTKGVTLLSFEFSDSSSRLLSGSDLAEREHWLTQLRSRGDQLILSGGADVSYLAKTTFGHFFRVAAEVRHEFRLRTAGWLRSTVASDVVSPGTWVHTERPLVHDN